MINDILLSGLSNDRVLIITKNSNWLFNISFDGFYDDYARGDDYKIKLDLINDRHLRVIGVDII